MKNRPIEFGGESVLPGQQRTIEIPLASMVTQRDLHLSLRVLHGRSPGPCLFVSAAIHGDEINGVEIIRRLLKRKALNRLKGTLVLAPIVNVHGFLAQSRYLPDGRDLNRSFPGSARGTLAGRIAHTFLSEVVNKCTHGIDLHTAARHRDNLPQIRADLNQDETRALATAFGVPVVMHSEIRDGSLRQVAGDNGIPILLYEAGEALRFNEVCIRAGVTGILNVMRTLKMLPPSRAKERAHKPVYSDTSFWVRAPESGIFRAMMPMGAKAAKGSVLGVIADPLGEQEVPVLAPRDGIVIGRTNLPLTHEGEALFHLAEYASKVDLVADRVELFQDNLEPEPGRPDGSGEVPIL
ncbi:succinylglutamate desuccinylase/aspartoacylase family protein [Ferrimonas balearica]|uniref:succinylglutamate desuccinylase/aspartoacylase family protein n=1 Tax=Ferrimonas balearica TaxID=44012 RepID=UPI001C99089F|nr:succinylglutamate desuccinylase/aspartoacylase family protein [Ferrimonas balearica]MBY5991008.1 succinylglutamate desuccinylase/aspartoacylase family protein [Ferrimonas balearica]